MEKPKTRLDVDNGVSTVQELKELLIGLCSPYFNAISELAAIIPDTEVHSYTKGPADTIKINHFPGSHRTLSIETPQKDTGKYYDATIVKHIEGERLTVTGLAYQGTLNISEKAARDSIEIRFPEGGEMIVGTRRLVGEDGTQLREVVNEGEFLTDEVKGLVFPVIHFLTEKLSLSSTQRD